MDFLPSLGLDLPQLPSDWKEILYENLNFGTLPTKSDADDVISTVENSECESSSTEDISEDVESLKFGETFHEMLKKDLESRIDKKDSESIPEDVSSIQDDSEDSEFAKTVEFILKAIEDVASEPADDEKLVSNSLLKIGAVKAKFESFIREIPSQEESEDVQNAPEESEDVDSMESLIDNVLNRLDALLPSKTVPEESSELENLFGSSSQSSTDAQLLEDIQKIQTLTSAVLVTDVEESEEQNESLDFYDELERVAALADDLFDLISAAASGSSEDVPEPSEFVEVITEASESSDSESFDDAGYDFHTALDRLSVSMDNAREYWTVNISEDEAEEDDCHDSDGAEEVSRDSESSKDASAEVSPSKWNPEAPEFIPCTPEEGNKCESSDVAPESSEEASHASDASKEYPKDNPVSKWTPVTPEGSEDVPTFELTPEDVPTSEWAPETPALTPSDSNAPESCSQASDAPEEAPEDVSTSASTTKSPEEVASESTVLTIKIPLETNSTPKTNDLLEEHLPLHILQKKTLLAEETHQFLTISLILQSQQASKNALLPLENSKYPDFDDLRVRELPTRTSDFNVPRRIQWQFIDFYARVHMFKAWDFVIQCQNAAGNSKKSIEELEEQRLRENGDLVLNRGLLMMKMEKLGLPDSVMRLRYDVAQQITRFKADALVIQSQLASQNARLPLALIQNPKWTMPHFDVSSLLSSLGFARIVPDAIKNQLESIINQCLVHLSSTGIVLSECVMEC